MAQNFNNFMSIALDEAKKSAKAGEIPVGAVIIYDGKPLATGQNRTRRDNDPTAHAEIVAIRQAARINQNFRLSECDLYVTLEPCAMCAGAIAESRIKRLYFGADDPKSGGTSHGAQVFNHPQCHHKPEIYDGIGAETSQLLLKQFFAMARMPKK